MWYQGVHPPPNKVGSAAPLLLLWAKRLLNDHETVKPGRENQHVFHLYW